VDHASHVRARDAEGLEAGEDDARLLLAPRGDLGDDDAPRGLVDRGEIGEHAADVDADEEHGRRDSRRTRRRVYRDRHEHEATVLATPLSRMFVDVNVSLLMTTSGGNPARYTVRPSPFRRLPSGTNRACLQGHGLHSEAHRGIAQY
jgi:hypothetical protein